MIPNRPPFRLICRWKRLTFDYQGRYEVRLNLKRRDDVLD